MPIASFFIIFFAMLLSSFPIAVSMGGIALLPSLIDTSARLTGDALIRSFVSGLDNFTLLAIPLFMFSGNVMMRGKLSNKLFDIVAYFIGNKRGGYPSAVVLTCLFFGAISGSGAATVAAVGAMSIPLLMELGYERGFSTAIVTVSGGLGVIIPPSVLFVAYASYTDASVSDLFMAGIVPGFLIALCMIVYIWFYCRRKGEDRVKLLENYHALHARGLWSLVKDGFWALLTPVIILGSIYSGIATPTEAAAISVLYSFIVCIFIYKTIKLKDILGILIETVKTYAPLLFILMCATGFSRVMTLMSIPQALSSVFLGASTNKYVIELMLLLLLLLIGCIFDGIPAIVIFTPLLLPIAKSIGMDIVHFGVVMTVVLAIGQVTPPMGVNLFVGSRIGEVPILTLARKSIPLLIAFLFAALLILLIPQISLCLV